MTSARPRPVSLMLLVALALVVVGVAWFVESRSNRPMPPTRDTETVGAREADAQSSDTPIDDPVATRTKLPQVEARGDWDVMLTALVGETTAWGLNPSPIDDLRLFGQLVAAESGQPIVGTLRLMEDFPCDRTISTSSDGTFEIRFFPAQKPQATAHAERRTREFFKVSDTYQDPAQPLLVRMSLAAKLEVRARDSAGDPVASALVEVSTSVRGIQGESFGTRSCVGVTDAGGCITFDELLPDVPVELHVSERGFDDIAETLELRPGEHRILDLALR